MYRNLCGYKGRMYLSSDAYWALVVQIFIGLMLIVADSTCIQPQKITESVQILENKKARIN